MSSIANIDLEKIILHFSRARLRGTARTQIELSSTDEDLGEVENDVVALRQVWIRRGNKLRVELDITLDERPMDAAMHAQVENRLIDAQVRL